MTLDEHFKSNAKILNEIKSDTTDELYVLLGPFTWIHEISSLENGVYKPKGLLQLPFVVENTDKENTENTLYTFFDKRFLTREGVIDPKDPSAGKMMDLIAWDNHVGTYFDSYGIRAYDKDILSGLESLFKTYFELRKYLKKEEEAGKEMIRPSYDIMMNCFTEYK